MTIGGTHMKRSLITLAIAVLLILVPVLTVVAIQTESTPVDISPYDDGDASVWGLYIVWRRAININDDTTIDFGTEPSWIMIHNIATGETWNITPANTINGHGNYEWAESPSIWNGKVIYEFVDGADAWNSHIYMYNISANTTWNVGVTTTYQGGHNCHIYDDWIMATHYGTSNRQLYLYNYITKEMKTLVSTSDVYTVGTISAYGDFYVYNRYNPATLVYQICIFNISSYQTLVLDATDIGANNLRLSDIYDTKILFYVLEVTPTSSWNEYIFDFLDVDWTSFGLSTQIQWTYIEPRTTDIDVDFTSDATGGAIWGNWVVYADYPGAVASRMSNVRAINYVTDQTLNLTYNAYDQIPTDIYMDKIVFQDNKNSPTNYGDRRDNFDIYRLTTDIEAMGSVVWNILPLVLVAMAVVAIGAASKIMGGGGRW